MCTKHGPDFLCGCAELGCAFRFGRILLGRTGVGGRTYVGIQRANCRPHKSNLACSPHSNFIN